MPEFFEDPDLLWPSTSLTQALGTTLDRLEANGGGRRRFTPTGVADIDQQIDGLISGELTVVGGLRGAGTTLLALRIAKHSATQDRAVLYVTTSDPIVTLTQRLLADESHVAARELDTGRIKRSDWERVRKAVQTLSQIPITFYNHPNPSVDQIVLAATQLERDARLGMVIIDQLQGIRGWARSTRSRISVVSALSSMAVSFDIPVLVLAQFRRKMNGEPGPYCSDDLQGSRAMEGIRHCVNLSTAQDRAGSSSKAMLRIDLEHPVHSTEPVYLRYDDCAVELRSAPLPNVV
jgi:replicative DNA helicase